MKNNSNIREKIIEKYWVRKISGMDAFFTRLSPAKTGNKWDSVSVEIEPAIVRRLTAMAKNNEKSEYIIYLSFFAVLLYKYFKHPRLLIYSPAMKTADWDNSSESVLFYELNINENHSLKKVLQDTRQEFLESIDYEGYDYNRLKLLLERKGIDDRLLYCFGLFDHRIHMNGETFEFDEGGLQLRFEAMGNQSRRFRVKFNGSRFEAGFIQQLASHYRNLLSSIQKDLEKTVGELDMLSPSEKQALLFKFNPTKTGYPKRKTIHQLFEEQVKRTPDHVALVGPKLQNTKYKLQTKNKIQNTNYKQSGALRAYVDTFGEAGLRAKSQELRAVTYKELNEKSNQLAYLLIEKGVKLDHIVGIMVERSIEMIIDILGILKAGGAYLPIDPGYPEKRINYMLADSSARFLVTTPGLTEKFTKLSIVNCQLLIISCQPEIACYAQSNSPLERGASSTSFKKFGGGGVCLAYIIYTSGTTGKPKGVMIEHGNVVRLMVNDRFSFDFDSTDVWTLFHSYCFDFSVWEMYGALLYGGKLVVIPREVAQDPNLFLRRLEKEQVTVLNQIPSIFNHLAAAVLKEEKKRKLYLRYVIFGGDALKPHLLKTWHRHYPEVKLVNMYGITETTVHVTYKEIAEKEIEMDKSNIGLPIPTLYCYIIGKNLGLEPMGIPGEIVVGGKGVGRGYLNRPALTDEKFIANPYIRGDRLYRSGDLGKRLLDGDIEFLGRIDNQVKIRGYRIECGEVENRLMDFEIINEAAVVPKEDKDRNNCLAAYFTAKEKVDITACRAYLEKVMPAYMVPTFYMQLEKFPLTPTGKIDKKALPEPVGMNINTSEAVYQAPRNDIEAKLAQIWQEVLRTENIGINDNFFNLGGNSIRGIHVVNKIQEWLREIIHVTVLFEAPTIKELAAKLDTYTAASRTKIDESKLAEMRQIIKPLAPLAVLSPKNPPAVFILSPPRSGTTLLRVILAGHPKLFAPPELELLGFNTLQERKKTLSGKYAYFAEGVIRAIMEIKNYETNEALSIMKEFEEQGLTSQQFYGVIQAWLEDKRLVDKTPWYALDMEILKRAEHYFEKPQYIHLLRNPYAVIHSFENAKLDQIFRYKHNFPVRQLAELVWFVCNQNIVEFLERVPTDRKHTVKFEELVNYPQQSVQTICTFLGIEYHEKMIRVYKNTGKKMLNGIHPESKMLGDINFFKHTAIDPEVIDKWKNKYKKAFLGDMTLGLANSLGYQQEKLVPDFFKMEPAPESGYYKLSHGQKRLWILAQMEENKSAYNIPGAYLFEGDLDREVLAKSFETVVRRHESLRTTFVIVEGEPGQRIHDFEDIGFLAEYIDLRDKEDAREQAKRLADEEATAIFDLQTGPLLRTKLVHLQEKRYVFLFTMHHIICDGWSMLLLIDELLTLYHAYRNNRENPLAPLQYQYKDYSVWWNSEKGQELLRKQEAYWLKEFTGQIPTLNLPIDYPRPGLRSFEGNLLYFSLDEGISKKIKNLALAEGVTLYMILLTVYTVFLSKICKGQEDIVIGAGIAGRRQPQLRKIIGMFVNTLALRYYPNGEKTFIKFLHEVKEKALLAFENQDYPFDTLVGKVVKKIDPSRTPLVENVFIQQNMELEPGESPGKEISQMKMKVNTFDQEIKIAKFDIVFSFLEVQNHLGFVMEYSTKLFKKETIEMFFSYFREILSAVIENKNIQIKNIRLASGLEMIKSTAIENDTGDFGF